MQTGLQGFLTKITRRLTRKWFQGFSSLLPNNSNIETEEFEVIDDTIIVY
jgi:hypothetical protein